MAKLDRLSRNVAFLSALMEAKVDFTCCDVPHATPLTLHILVAVAQQEAADISERTKRGLAVSTKLKGSRRPGFWSDRLNCPACRNDAERRAACTECGGTGKTSELREVRRVAGSKLGLQRGVAAVIRNAKRQHAELCPQIVALRAEGLTLQQIADRLNDEGLLTPRGKRWISVYVCRFLKQCDANAVGV